MIIRKFFSPFRHCNVSLIWYLKKNHLSFVFFIWYKRSLTLFLSLHCIIRSFHIDVICKYCANNLYSVFDFNYAVTISEVSVEVQPEEVETPAAPAEDTGAPEAPRFTQTLQRQLDVYEGTSVTLVCVVIGHPRPTVTWYQVNGKCLTLIWQKKKFLWKYLYVIKQNISLLCLCICRKSKKAEEVHR